MARITWNRTADNLESGTAGKRALFTLTDISTEGSPLFALRTTLPTGRILWKRADGEVLKRHAEKVLATFVTDIGAMLLAEIESPTVADEEPCCDDRSPHYHCGSCGELGGMMGHYVGGAGGRIICDPQERRAYLRGLVSRDA